MTDRALVDRAVRGELVIVPGLVYLVVRPCVGTLGEITGFRELATARAVAGKDRRVVVVGPFVPLEPARVMW